MIMKMKTLFTILLLSLSFTANAQAQVGTLVNPRLPNQLLPVKNGGSTQIQITYTGTITTPIILDPFLEISVPVGARSGSQTYAPTIVGVNQILISGDTGIHSMIWNNLQTDGGSNYGGIIVSNCNHLISLGFPTLTTAYRYSITHDSSLTSFS